MELLLKIIALCLLAALLAVFLRPAGAGFGLLLTLSASAFCLLLLLEAVQPMLFFLESVLQRTQMEEELFLPLFKVLGISLVVRLGGNFCRDSGSSLGGALIELAGAFCALLTMLPVLQKVLQQLLQWI